MDWDERDYFDEKYYEDVLSALESRCFISTTISYDPIYQVGVWIVERVDAVLKEEIHEEFPSLLKNKVIEVFLSVITHHWSEVDFHIRSSIGALTYSGILDTEDTDIFRMWNRIFIMSRSDCSFLDSWLARLAETVIHDKQFVSKVADLCIYAERGMDEESIFEALAEDYDGPENIKSLKELCVV